MGNGRIAVSLGIVRVEQLHVMNNNLGGGAIRTVLILPLLCPQLALHIGAAALVQILVANLGQPGPGNNTVPFSMLLRLAVLAFPAFAGGQAERCNRSAALCVAKIRVSAIGRNSFPSKP